MMLRERSYSAEASSYLPWDVRRDKSTRDEGETCGRTIVTTNGLNARGLLANPSYHYSATLKLCLRNTVHHNHKMRAVKAGI